MTITSMIMWILGFATNIAYLYLLQVIKLYGCLLVFSAGCFICAIYAIIFIPETKGKSHESVAILLGKLWTNFISKLSFCKYLVWYNNLINRVINGEAECIVFTFNFKIEIYNLYTKLIPIICNWKSIFLFWNIYSCSYSHLCSTKIIISTCKEDKFFFVDIFIRSFIQNVFFNTISNKLFSNVKRNIHSNFKWCKRSQFRSNFVLFNF